MNAVIDAEISAAEAQREAHFHALAAAHLLGLSRAEPRPGLSRHYTKEASFSQRRSAFYAAKARIRLLGLLEVRK